MGFDLIGRKPTGERGAHFYNNNRWWWALWDYVTHYCRDILTREQARWGYLNQNIVIHATQAHLMACRLHHLREAGKDKEFEHEMQDRYEGIPCRICRTCNVAGFRVDDLTCSSCGRMLENSVLPGSAAPFSTKNVDAFGDFCSQSGGFYIC